MNLPAATSGGGIIRAQELRAARVARDSGASIRFGAWQLTRLLRRGDRTAVFRARLSDRDLGPGCYAIKTGRKEGDAIAAAMLRREALVAYDVVNPHLIAVLAAGQNAPPDYLVTPYLEGLTLRRLLLHANGERAARLPIASALSIMRQTAAALAELHQAGWLHGQVRPEHILVSPQGHATLIDLTQARRLGSSECDLGDDLFHSLTYAAPDWYSSRRRLAKAADTYALGIVLYELITGQPPFVATNARQLIAMHRTGAPPELRQVRPEAAQQTSELVRRMLAKEPLRRPSDEELSRWLAELEIEELAA
jgi:serine/threonine protein kinase